MRWIAHLDMDAFYASVELLRYPELKGLPVVVGGGSRAAASLRNASERSGHDEGGDAVDRDRNRGNSSSNDASGASRGTRRFAALRDYAGRGVVTTATYAARAFGVHSGMGLMKAAALTPDAILLPTDFDEYRKFSRRFKAAVVQIAPLIEDRGIDEIYIDLTDVPGAQDGTPDDPHAGVRALGRRLKQCVTDATGLTCSVGITPNKLLSKLCSDLEKPDGLTLLTAADIQARIWPLPAKRINGIGPKANARLEALGIKTIGDLAAAEPTWLMEHFGANYGAWLHAAACGRDDHEVVTYREPKSLSRETTFERDLHPRTDRAALGALLTQLCEQVAADLLRKGFVARNIGVKLRYDDFKIVTRAVSLPTHTADAADIRRAVGQCLKRNVPLDQPLRLLGVRAGALCRPESVAEATAATGAGAVGTPFTLPLF